MVITNYTPPAERAEDLPLSTGETVRLLSEDGVWAFVCTVDPAKRRGWVPSSMLKRKGGLQHPPTRRSLSVGDIHDAFQEEETAAQRMTPIQKRPVPTPRGDVTGAPSEEAPPLPGAPPSHDPKPGKKTLNDKHLNKLLSAEYHSSTSSFSPHA